MGYVAAVVALWVATCMISPTIADPSGSVKQTEPPESWRVTVGAAGDVVCHERVKDTANLQSKTPDQAGDERLDGWWYIFKKLQPSVETADVALVNLETPLATERNKATDANPVMNGPAVLATALKETGFDMLNLANNHMFDQKRQGVAETIDAVQTAGLPFFGAGKDRDSALKPTVKKVNGATIAFLGWTYNSNRLPNNRQESQPWVAKWNRKQAEQAVSQARNSADLVVVSMHFDADYRFVVQKHQKRVANILCGAGADFIVGTGPHVLHSVERIHNETLNRDCLVAYSLGNLVSNHGYKYRQKDYTLRNKRIPATYGESRDGLFLRATFVKRGDDIFIDAVEGVALWTENNWLEHLVTPTAHRISINPIEKALALSPKTPEMLSVRLSAIKKTVGDVVSFVEE